MQGRNPHGVHTASLYHSNIIISYYPSICSDLIMFSLDVGAIRSPIQVLTLLDVLTIQQFFQYCDRQSLITWCRHHVGFVLAVGSLMTKKIWKFTLLLKSVRQAAEVWRLMTRLIIWPKSVCQTYMLWSAVWWRLHRTAKVSSLKLQKKTLRFNGTFTNWPHCGWWSRLKLVLA